MRNQKTGPSTPFSFWSDHVRTGRSGLCLLAPGIGRAISDSTSYCYTFRVLSILGSALPLLAGDSCCRDTTKIAANPKEYLDQKIFDRFEKENHALFNQLVKKHGNLEFLDLLITKNSGV
ncbi:unnamed protein product [Agarophyton chilense]